LWEDYIHDFADIAKPLADLTAKKYQIKNVINDICCHLVVKMAIISTGPIANLNPYSDNEEGYAMIRAFLSAVGFVRKFISNCTGTRKPLADFTEKENGDVVKWKFEHQQAYRSNAIK